MDSLDSLKQLDLLAELREVVAVRRLGRRSAWSAGGVYAAAGMVVHVLLADLEPAWA